MRAAVLMEPGASIVVDDVEPAALGPRDARVRVDASGVCRTDLSLSVRPGLAPTVLGHEGAGTVVEVGREVSRVHVGDRVIASFAPVCGHCFYCVRAESTQCTETAQIHGVERGICRTTPVVAMAGLGTFAEMMTVSEFSLVPVQTDLPAEHLALLGCGVTTGVGSALWTAGVQPGSTVTVYGCGGVGLFAIQGARIAGAERIFAVDPLESKRQAAVRVGATDPVDPDEGDPVAQIRSSTQGRGTDYAIELVGKPYAILQAYETARPRGTVVVAGMGPAEDTVTLPGGMMFRQEKKILGSFYGSAQVLRDMPTLVQLAESGKLDIGAAISRTIRLDQINDALHWLADGVAIRSVIVHE